LKRKYQNRVENGKQVFQHKMNIQKEKREKMQEKKNIRDAYKFASQMYVNCKDHRIDKNYIINFLPSDVFEKMKTTFEWTDDEGYKWGFRHVMVDRDDKGVFIQMASIDNGMGNFASKVLRIDTGDIENKNYC
jgi:hypothetical protein